MVRQLVPRAVRHGISAQLARVHASAPRARSRPRWPRARDTIVAGPGSARSASSCCTGCRSCAGSPSAFHVAPERLLVVSRGGTASWYRPFAAGYREIFDYLTPEEFRRRHDERVAANGEQKQTQVLAFERAAAARAHRRTSQHRSMLHPSSDVRTVQPVLVGTRRRVVGARARAATRGSTPTAVPGFALPARPVHGGEVLLQRLLSRRPTRIARSCGARCRRWPRAARSSRWRPVCASTITTATTPRRSACSRCRRDLHPRENLALQTAVVAGASAFVGTYGGFSYLAPFLGVRSTAYYSDRARLLAAAPADGALGARVASAPAACSTCAPTGRTDPPTPLNRAPA